MHCSLPPNLATEEARPAQVVAPVGGTGGVLQGPAGQQQLGQQGAEAWQKAAGGQGWGSQQQSAVAGQRWQGPTERQQQGKNG